MTGEQLYGMYRTAWKEAGGGYAPEWEELSEMGHGIWDAMAARLELAPEQLDLLGAAP